MNHWRRLLLALWLTAALYPACRADVVQVAVAANFAEPIKAIAAALQHSTGHQLRVTLGSTGTLAAQIRNGAPFDVFFAANTDAPAALERDGLTVPGSRFTYATGRLVLWSTDARLVDSRGDVLRNGHFRRLAYANPVTAPYGRAAIEVMERLGLRERLSPQLVQGESIGQTMTFVATGNAELGFVALSQVLEDGHLRSGSLWMIPPSLYAPIRQDVALLRHGSGNPAAQALLQLLHSPRIAELIRAYGYEL